MTFDCERRGVRLHPAARALTRESPTRAAFDRELRTALGSKVGSAFLRPRPRRRRSVGKSRLARFARRCRWLSKLRRNVQSPRVVDGKNLKTIDRAAGRAGPRSKLNRDLDVDGVLVGHIRVAADDDKSRAANSSSRPDVWLFTARTNRRSQSRDSSRWQLSQADGYLDRDQARNDSSQSNGSRAFARGGDDRGARVACSNFDVARTTGRLVSWFVRVGLIGGAMRWLPVQLARCGSARAESQPVSAERRFRHGHDRPRLRLARHHMVYHATTSSPVSFASRSP